MKANKFVMLIASVGLVFGMMTGCGGGGSGEDPAPTATLDEKDVNAFVGEVSNAVGCNYTTNGQVAQNKQLNAALSLKTVGVTKNIIVNENLLKLVQETSRSAKTTQDINGTCGGTIVIELDDSNTTVDITFTNYCNDEITGEKTLVNGAVHVSLSQSDTVITIAASTPTPLNIKTTNPNTSENLDATIALQDGQVTANLDQSTGDLTTLAASVTSLTLTDNTTQKSCTITNVNANVNMVSESATFSAGLDCTDLGGKVNVSGSANSSGQGSVTLTDASGKEATLTQTATADIFDVSFDNAAVGTMDCSDVNVTIPEL